MKTLFTIGAAEQAADTLLLEIGQDHCCYAFFDRSANAFSFIRYLTFSEPEESLESLFDEWKSPQQVVVCSAGTQALLVPQKFFQPKPSLVAAVYDPDRSHELNDRIPEWQMVNTYALPAAVYEQLIARFPDARFFHAYTPALKIHNGFDAPDQVDIHFTTTHFRVLVKKGGEVQLMQTYGYKVPLDVVYFLLKICYELGLEQEQVFLIVSGLIDKDSALYEELHHYFLNLHFAKEPACTLPASDHPPYYFTSLYNLAACVS